MIEMILFFKDNLGHSDYFKSVKGDLKAIRDEVNDYLRSSVWRSDARLTLNGLIDFCEDYSDLEKVYNKIITYIKNKRRGYYKNINIRGERNKACLQLSFNESFSGRITMSIIYSTDRSDLNDHLVNDKPFEKSVAFHLEPYRNYDDFSSAMRVIFNQVFKSYQNACARGQKRKFYSLLYGQYCIDTRTNKIFKHFLSPKNFVENFMI